MKRAGIVVGAVLLLALTGCTQSTDVDAAPEASETTTPLMAESPSVASGHVDGDDAEAAFLEQVRSQLRPDTQIPNATDEQLLEAGERACLVIVSGEDTTTASLIEGEQPNAMGSYFDSGAIIVSARANLCAS